MIRVTYEFDGGDYYPKPKKEFEYNRGQEKMVKDDNLAVTIENISQDFRDLQIHHLLRAMDYLAEGKKENDYEVKYHSDLAGILEKVRIVKVEIDK